MLAVRGPTVVQPARVPVSKSPFKTRFTQVGCRDTGAVR